MRQEGIHTLVTIAALDPPLRANRALVPPI
jgi:hypothetical protein